MRFTSVQQLERYMIRNDKLRDDHYTLDRMQEAIKRLGRPDHLYTVIHVAGTSGKGSTCQILNAILLASGTSVGLFTSPAIVGPLERIRINNRPITEREFLKHVNVLFNIVGDLRLTYFELFTLAALYIFAQKKVQYVVLETGMGGRLDATNVVDSKLALITDIGLDHTEVLGNTLLAIAKEKAGIIKPGSKAFTTSPYIVRANARVRLIRPERATIVIENLSGTHFHWGSLRNLHLSLIGDYQIRNAVLAITAVQHLGITQTAIRKGLKAVRNPGRFEIVSRRPLIIIDGAHNPQKMLAFTSALQRLVPQERYSSRIGLIAMKFNKDFVKTLRPLVQLLDEVVITSFQHGAKVSELRNVIKQLKPSMIIHVQSRPQRAYQQFRERANETGFGVVVGSLYLIGELRQASLV